MATPRRPGPPVPPKSKFASSDPAIAGQRPSQSQATLAPPQADQGKAQVNADFTTFFTKATGDSELIYNGDRNWVKVTFLLETAGPVAVGNRAAITPVLSGQGQLLITGTPKTMTVGKGVRIWIASTSVNRVQYSVEPLPWLEQITATLGALLGKLTR